MIGSARAVVAGAVIPDGSSRCVVPGTVLARRLRRPPGGGTVTQLHLDRLSAIDAGFLAQEKPNTHMHIGGLILLDGPPPAPPDFLAHVRSRLHLGPRDRQKLAFPPLGARPPPWGDDPP